MLDAASTIVGLIDATLRAVRAITAFVQDCRAAGSDFRALKRELTRLRPMLQSLEGHIKSKLFPSWLQNNINDDVRQCERIVLKIEDVVHNCRGRSGAIVWAASKKQEVTGLRNNLETCRRTLDSSVLMALLFAVLSTHDNTRRLLDLAGEDLSADLLGDRKSRTFSFPTEKYPDGHASDGETACEYEIGSCESDEEDGIKRGSCEIGVSKITESGDENLQDTKENEPNEEEGHCEPEPAERKCYKCELLKADGGSFGSSCKHWLCNECLRQSFKEATYGQRGSGRYSAAPMHYCRPKCNCGEGFLSPKSAAHVFDSQLEKAFCSIWGRRESHCPKCKEVHSILVERQSPRRTKRRCRKCRYEYCARCEKKYHAGGYSKCKEIRRPFLPTFESSK